MDQKNAVFWIVKVVFALSCLKTTLGCVKLHLEYKQSAASCFEDMSGPAVIGNFSEQWNKGLVAEYNLIERTELNECKY